MSISPFRHLCAIFSNKATACPTITSAQFEGIFEQLNGLLFLGGGAQENEYSLIECGKGAILTRFKENQTVIEYEFDPLTALNALVNLIYDNFDAPAGSNNLQRLLEAQSTVSLISLGEETDSSAPPILPAYLELDIPRMKSQANLLVSSPESRISNLGQNLLKALDRFSKHKSATEQPKSFSAHDNRDWLLANLAGCISDKDYLEAGELVFAESVLSLFSKDALERLQENVTANASDRASCLAVWIEALLFDCADAKAQGLAYRFLAEVVTVAPLVAHTLVVAIGNSEVLPANSLDSLIYRMMERLASDSSAQAGITLSHCVSLVAPKIAKQEPAIYETLKDPASFVQTLATKLLGSGHEREALELVKAAGVGKVVQLNAPAVFDLCLRLLRLQFAHPQVAIAQWDLFHMLSRKQLSPMQGAALKAMLNEMPLGCHPSWIVGLGLVHVDVVSPFLTPVCEFEARHQMVVANLNAGIVESVLPNIYRMLQLPSDNCAEVVQKLVFDLVRVLCNKEWLPADVQIAHAIFEQAAKNPEFPMGDALHLQLMQKATTAMHKSEACLMRAIDNILKKDRASISHEELRACFAALGRANAQKDSESNRSRRIAVVELLVTHKMAEQALQLLENVHLAKHGNYPSLVKDSFALLLTCEAQTRPQVLAVCDKFYKKTNAHGLDEDTLEFVLSEIFFACLTDGDVKGVTLWRKRLQEQLKEAYPHVWREDFGSRFIDICQNHPSLSAPLVYFLGECLTSYASAFVGMPASCELAERVVKHAMDRKADDMKSVVLLLLSTYEIADASYWQHLLESALSTKDGKYANNVFTVFVKRHSSGVYLQPAANWALALTFALKHASFAVKLDLLTEGSACMKALTDGNESAYLPQIAGMFDVILTEMCERTSAQRQADRARFRALLEYVSQLCAALPEAEIEYWKEIVELIPPPQSLMAQFENFEEAFKKGKQTQAMFDNLVFKNYMQETDVTAYDDFVLPAIEQVAVKASASFPGVRVIRHLLTQERQACDDTSRKLLLQEPTNAWLRQKHNKGERAAFNADAKKLFDKLLDRSQDLRTIDEMRSGLTHKNIKAFYTDSQVEHLRKDINERYLRSQANALVVDFVGLPVSQKAARLDSLLVNLKKYKQDIDNPLNFVGAVQTLICYYSADGSFKFHACLKIIDFLLLWVKHETAAAGVMKSVAALMEDATIAFMMEVSSCTLPPVSLESRTDVIRMQEEATKLLIKIVQQKLFKEEFAGWAKTIIASSIPSDWVTPATQAKWRQLLVQAKKGNYFKQSNSTFVFLDLLVSSDQANFSADEITDVNRLSSLLNMHFKLLGPSGTVCFDQIKAKLLHMGISGIKW